MPWDDWLAAWKAHSSLRQFADKVVHAGQIAYEGHAKGSLYGSLSGGKDSVALAGLLVECKIEVPWCHAHTWLNLPDTLATVDAIADQLDLRLDLVESEEDPSALLPGLDALEGQAMTDLCNRFSAGELLRQYCYLHGYDGHFDGCRADENKRTRGRLFRSRGPVWQSRVDRKWSCSPLAWWSARDSFAFCVSRGLPIHPFYRRVAELQLDPEHARVDWLLGPWLDPGRREDDTCRAVRWAYPERWAELVRILPALKQLS
jgi:3'-phosphoadenosine 5'-phosphosulfate sulfotransferase (PAPS reductase)/FAD synthetase